MEYTPGRAPFTEDEDYKPLRMPKSAVNAPNHSNTFNSLYNSQASSSLAGFQRTISPSKLSPLAQVFEPSTIQDRTQNQRLFQEQHIQQTYYQQQQQQQPKQHQHHQNAYHNQHHHRQQQHHHQQHQHHQQQPQQQHQHQPYANGFQQMSQQHNNSHHQQQQQYVHQISSQVQDRLKISNFNSNNSSSSTSKNSSTNYYNNSNQRQRNQQSYHSGNRRAQTAVPPPPPPQTSALEVETVALDYLQTVIQCLNQNPGQFDTVATRFLTIFDGMENNNYVLCNAMEDIFHESIENPNFRYMGAKLYNLLHMLNLKKDSLFHTLLKCKLDYHQNELVEFMKQPNQQQKVRETALFLAELYMQLRGDDSRIHLIAENIVFALKQLLHKVNADNVRCICLTLKLAGYDLTADCPTDMHQIIGHLETINSQQPGKFPLAVNVISLQKNNWGRKHSSSNSMCDEEEKLKMPEPLRTSDEPIFYGPDGRELTAEEAEFLTSHTGVAGAAGSGSTDEEDVADLDLDFDPEMDEETEKAYKEFCKLNTAS